MRLFLHLMCILFFAQSCLMSAQTKAPVYSLKLNNNLYVFDDSHDGFKIKIPQQGLFQSTKQFSDNAKFPISFCLSDPSNGMLLDASYNPSIAISSVADTYKKLSTPSSKKQDGSPRQVKLEHISHWESLWYVTDHGTSSRLHLLANHDDHSSVEIHLSVPFYTTKDESESKLRELLSGIQIERYNAF